MEPPSGDVTHVSDDADKASTPGAMDWILENYDEQTTEGPDIDAELARLKVLKSFQLLDKDRESCYDRFAQMAARIFDAPLAFINLVDLGRIWQVAGYGVDLSEDEDLPRDMPRVTSPCAHTILQKEFLLVVPDMSQDRRFQTTPWATAGVKFYAGTPLISPEGANIGTLCIMDSRARVEAFGEEEQEQLVDLAAAIVDLMAEKRQSLQVSQPDYPGFTYSVEIQRAATRLRQHLSDLKEDGDFSTVASDASRNVLRSAFECADFLFASLVPEGGRVIEGSDQPGGYMPRINMPPPPQRDSSFGSTKIGDDILMDIKLFVKSLETAMEAFPRKVHLSFSCHSDVPPVVCFNDLKVFRAAIALLTSACERTQEGFVRFKIYPDDEGDVKALVFQCEDTGRDVDLDRFGQLFQAPTGGIDVGFAECIRLNAEGRVEHSSVCDDEVDTEKEPVAGGFAVHPVAQYIGQMGGKYGFRPRFVTSTNAADSGSGSIFWFSIPLRTSKPGASATVPGSSAIPDASSLDSAIDSALAPSEGRTVVGVQGSQSIHRVDASAAATRSSWMQEFENL